MSTRIPLTDSLEDLVTGPKGRRSYKDAWSDQILSRLDEQNLRLDDQSQRITGLESTIKTMNGMAQLAVQQIATMQTENGSLREHAKALNLQVGQLSKELGELKALMPPDENGSETIKKEAKGS